MMITGIYNLPEEMCYAVGEAVSSYLSDNSTTDYTFDVKNAFSILSEDSKMMLLEFWTAYADVEIKYTSMASVGSVEGAKFLYLEVYALQIMSRLFISIFVEESAPDQITVSVVKI